MEQENRFKYPRTFHFSWSKGMASDDKIIHDLSNFEGKEVVATIKYDGENCVDGDTLVITDHGNMKIKDICDNKLNYNALSYNTELNLLEFKQIISHHISENKDIDEWFEIELENGNTVKLTSEHRVYLPDLGVYRKVCELNTDDNIIFLP